MHIFLQADSYQKTSIHHRGTPPLSVCRPTPRSQSKKSHGVYHLLGKTREKGIHHRSGEKGIHHRASDPGKEKGGFPRWGILFSSLDSVHASAGKRYHPNTNDGRRVNSFLSEIQNYIAEADADLIPAPGQLELHGRCRCGVVLSLC